MSNTFTVVVTDVVTKQNTTSSSVFTVDIVTVTNPGNQTGMVGHPI